MINKELEKPRIQALLIIQCKRRYPWSNANFVKFCNISFTSYALPFFQFHSLVHYHSLFFRVFPGLANCFANFKTFSRPQDSVRTLFLGEVSWMRSTKQTSPMTNTEVIKVRGKAVTLLWVHTDIVYGCGDAQWWRIRVSLISTYLLIVGYSLVVAKTFNKEGNNLV